MLNMDPVVQVNVSVGASFVPSGVFDVGAILTSSTGTANGTGDGAVLSTTHRFAVYNKLDDVLNGVLNGAPSFANTTDVYKAAAKYFGVSPAPAKIVVIFYDTTSGTTETPTSAMLDAIDNGAEFYGVYYSPKPEETAANIKANIVAIASALNSLNRGVLFYGVTGTASQVAVVDGIMDSLKNVSAKRAVGMACTTETDDAAGLMGIAMGYGRNSDNAAFALCYKSIASATENGYSQSEVETIKAVNGNVYVARTKTRAGLENGATASGLRYDDVLYVDKIANEIQTNVYSMIADSQTKLPQNDTTTTLFISEINRILEHYYDIGVLYDAEWRGSVYSGMEEGMIIDHGYYVFADTFDNQTPADRNQHKAMPITVLLCLSGSVESIVINLDVQT